VSRRCICKPDGIIASDVEGVLQRVGETRGVKASVALVEGGKRLTW